MHVAVLPHVVGVAPTLSGGRGLKRVSPSVYIYLQQLVAPTLSGGRGLKQSCPIAPCASYSVSRPPSAVGED